MSLWTLAQTYRSMQRMRVIVGVLSRHGFHQFVDAAGLMRFVPFARRLRHGVEKPTTSAPERLRLAFEELGPTFVKLGQMLSTRPDLVPEAYAIEFGKLREEVAPFPFDGVRRAVEEELETTLAEVFLAFEEKPLAAASMAQVHRAVRADGRHVVVKVRRPGIERTVHRDLGVLQLLIGALEKYVPESRDLDLPAILDEFSRTIRHELDFFREASNTERLRHNLEKADDALIPAVHWDLTSERMMVQDEVVGVSPADPEALVRAGHDPKLVARQIAKLYMKQVLDDGVFHGDLHAGNVRVTPDGRIAFLDFGAVGYLTGEMQESLGNFFLALLSQDYAAMAEEYVKLGARESLVEERAFERDLRELIEPYFGRPMSDLRVGPILREAVIVALRHHIRLPREMILLGRSTLAVEGMIARLDPELVILEEALPQAKKLLLRRFDPRRQVRRLQRVARDYQETIRRLPNQVTRVFQRLLDSRLSIEFVHRGYEKALLEVDRASNRVSVSLIISALIVGSALIVLSGKGPMLWNFPIFGMAGFLLAAVMGFGLAIVILRSGKL